MKLFPESLEEKLEISQVREHIAEYCQSQAATEHIFSVRPYENYLDLSSHLIVLKEFMALHYAEAPLPKIFSNDITIQLNRSTVAGIFLETEDILEIYDAAKSIQEWISLLTSQKLNFPTLFQLIDFQINPKLLVTIDHSIDDRGRIKDTASSRLQEIRNHLYKAEQQVRKEIRRILDKTKKEEYSETESEVTIREGRLVIPLKAEYKRKIQGIIHDESQTGQTVFMEPLEILTLNNEVKSWEYEEKRELQRILTVLTDAIRAEYTQLTQGMKFLVAVDYLHALVLFAKELKATVPKVNKRSGIKLVHAKHPVLQRRFQKEKKEIVPFSLELTHAKTRFLLISGPNAGGKSVTLKTTGLLQFLAQCGIPVTANDHSEFGFFKQIFVDIGDEQSLEDDLSTYSSRLKYLSHFISESNADTLILLDELGAGTEPRFGGAIAEGVLTKLVASGAYGVVTTHYSNLKELANKTAGMQNAAMMYDTRELRPLFQLLIGQPGSSFAFEIAIKSGIPDGVLGIARQAAGGQQVDYDQMLSQLQTERKQIENQQILVNKKLQEAEKLKRDYEAVKTMVQTEKNRILSAARVEAKKTIESANQQIERTIREIREAQADKERTKKLREELASNLKPLLDTVADTKSKKENKNVSVGDKVQIDDQEDIGELLAIQGKQAQVQLGEFSLWVALDRLKKTNDLSISNSALQKRKTSVITLEKSMHFSQELDVRGKRVEEVLPILDKFMDDVLLLGITEIKVIHGKGTGVLRSIVRKQIAGYKQVEKIDDEHADRGGAGVTIINLKYN